MSWGRQLADVKGELAEISADREYVELNPRSRRRGGISWLRREEARLRRLVELFEKFATTQEENE